nr:uncharacterized protein LOC109731796 [Aegilops tauschii subsp. strangulata]
MGARPNTRARLKKAAGRGGAPARGKRGRSWDLRRLEAEGLRWLEWRRGAAAAHGPRMARGAVGRRPARSGEATQRELEAWLLRQRRELAGGHGGKQAGLGSAGAAAADGDAESGGAARASERGHDDERQRGGVGARRGAGLQRREATRRLRRRGGAREGARRGSFERSCDASSLGVGGSSNGRRWRGRRRPELGSA